MKAKMIIFLEGQPNEITEFYSYWETRLTDSYPCVSKTKIHYDRKEKNE